MDDLLEVFDLFGIGEGLFEIAETILGALAVLVVVLAVAALLLVADVGATGLVIALVLAAASAGTGFVAGAKVTKLRSAF